MSESAEQKSEQTMPLLSATDIPHGFRFAGIAAGIKASGKPDLTLITGAAGHQLVAAGVYTQNLIRAASIDWNRAITPSNAISGLIINSGNANACTGELGRSNNKQMAQIFGDQLNATAEQILVLSTGVIGEQLPMDCISSHAAELYEQLGNSVESFCDAARGILTTDRSPKMAARKLEFEGEEIAIAGMCKGAGMIGPRMATMLGVITTDVNLTPEQAQNFLQKAVNGSFNCISVDGHMSTNDAVILLSSQQRQVAWSDDFENKFSQTLLEICIDLAKQIPDDGEGSEHLVEIQVTGTETDPEADAIARCIAASNLVKTAISGCDPNWGRIVSAAGYANIGFNPANVSLALNGHKVFEHGTPCEFAEADVSASMKNSRETLIKLSVGPGPGFGRHWTSDLTYEYVRINSEYRT